MAAFTVELASDDPERSHRLFGDGLGLARRGEDTYGMGDLRIRVLGVAPGEATGLRRLDLHDPSATDRSRRLVADGHARSVADEELIDLHGMQLGLVGDGTGQDADRPPAADANVRGLDHLGVASDATASLVSALTSLGFHQESRQIDTQMAIPMEVFSSDRYGVVSHAGEPEPAGSLLVTFLRCGTLDVEILEDIMTGCGEDGGGPGSTTGDNRAISRFVARRGGGLHHLAVRVADIAAGIERLEDHGIGMIDRRGRPGSRRARIAFVDRRTTGGVVMHLVQRP